MKKLIAGLILALFLGVGSSQAVLAEHGKPKADCAPPFGEPHHLSDHDGHHYGQHRHIGIDLDRVDLNGDGYLCVKHISPEKHLHIDNNVRKK